MYRFAALVALALPGALTAQEALPPPSGYPLRIDFSNDPILGLRREAASPAQFRELIASAVRRHPALGEASALEDEAETLIEQAQAARLPTVDATLTTSRTVAREFSNDPGNILERTRPDRRTDALLQVQQTLFDFGAGLARVRAAGARLRAARADVEDTSDRVALSAIGAWYDVFGQRALVALTQAFIDSQREIRSAVEFRIRQGASAPADLARVDSYIAQAQTRLARFRRQLANAEARFAELTGRPPPAVLARAPAPAPGTAIASRDEATEAARNVPGVRSAEAAASSAQQEARAARADRWPQVTAGIDAGRYGVFENERDFDVRGRLTVRMRLFGGVDARADQYQARARAAGARADRVREEAARDAAIAWADVRALEEQLQALEAAYIASRQSRDAIVERFRVARGTLFDVLAAEDAYFEAATSYVQALTELDAARYVLLSRTGRLLDLLEIEPAG